MELRQQIDQMSNELDALCNRWAGEYEIPFAVAIGILATKTHLLIQQAEEQAQDEAQDESGQS